MRSSLHSFILKPCHYFQPNIFKNIRKYSISLSRHSNETSNNQFYDSQSGKWFTLSNSIRVHDMTLRYLSLIKSNNSTSSTNRESLFWEKLIKNAYIPDCIEVPNMYNSPSYQLASVQQYIHTYKIQIEVRVQIDQVSSLSSNSVEFTSFDVTTNPLHLSSDLSHVYSPLTSLSDLIHILPQLNCQHIRVNILVDPFVSKAFSLVERIVNAIIDRGISRIFLIPIIPFNMNNTIDINDYNDSVVEIVEGLLNIDVEGAPMTERIGFVGPISTVERLISIGISQFGVMEYDDGQTNISVPSSVELKTLLDRLHKQYSFSALPNH